MRNFLKHTSTQKNVVPQLTDNKWYYRVKAVDHVGNESTWSNAISFNIDTQAPEISMTNFMPDPYNDPRPLFSWQAASEAIKYRLVVPNDRQFTNNIINFSNITATNYQPSSDLTAGTLFWKVAAIDLAGNQSSYSISKYFTLDTSLPSTPVLNSIASPNNDTTPTLNWSTVEEAAKYVVQIASNDSFNALIINDASITTTTYTSSNLPDGIYYARVAAIDSANNQGDHNFTLTTLRETGHIGKHVSLTVDKKNNPHLVYYDEINTNLIYGNLEVNGHGRSLMGMSPTPKTEDNLARFS